MIPDTAVSVRNGNGTERDSIQFTPRDANRLCSVGLGCWLLNASPAVVNKLLQYRDAGIQVAIDDFGTGYSSLTFLHHFSGDAIKIALGPSWSPTSDRLSFISFVPKSFARPSSRGVMLARAVGQQRPDLKAHLTIQQLDVLQDDYDEMRAHHGLVGYERAQSFAEGGAFIHVNHQEMQPRKHEDTKRRQFFFVFSSLRGCI